MADEDKADKCEHKPCRCTTTGDDDYCSEYCRASHSTDITELACGCEHPACRA